jgi:putative glutamine amidotransferase
MARSVTVAILVGRDPELRYSLHRGYADAVWAAGATPVVLTPPPNFDDLGRYVELALTADAVLLAGGGDVDPACYGQVPASALMDVDPVRDRAELATVVAARHAGRRRRLPSPSAERSCRTWRRPGSPGTGRRTASTRRCTAWT